MATGRSGGAGEPGTMPSAFAFANCRWRSTGQQQVESDTALAPVSCPSRRMHRSPAPDRRSPPDAQDGSVRDRLKAAERGARASKIAVFEVLCRDESRSVCEKVAAPVADACVVEVGVPSRFAANRGGHWGGLVGRCVGEETAKRLMQTKRKQTLLFWDQRCHCRRAHVCLLERVERLAR